MPDQDEFAPQTAVKSKIPLKICISGPGGSGKTKSALALAYNLLRASGMPDKEIAEKLYVIDTENGSASLYSDEYPFKTIIFASPYTPERYIKAMQRAISCGAAFMIVDSGSHEWAGVGGCMSMVDAAKGSGNDYAAWSKVTPRHDAFVEWIKDCPIDMIVALRAKVAYVLELNNKSKTVPKKVGLEPIQRPGFDYEFSVSFMIDDKHKTKADKDRTQIFEGDDYDLRTPEVALALYEWRANGVDFTPRPMITRAESVDRAKPKDAPPREAVQARKPNLITTNAKGKFWLDARKSGKSDEDVRRYLVERFSIDSSSKIPAEFTEEAIAWASKPLPTRHVAPGEEKCRELARTLQISESDLIYEVAMCRNDWNATYERLSRAEDARLAAIEAADEAAAMATA